MAAPNLLDKYADKIKGVLNCYDRVVITGTLPEICYAQAMTRFLFKLGILVFKYTEIAQTWRDQIRHNAEQIAAEHDIKIEFVRKNNFRKEQRIKLNTLPTVILVRTVNHPP